MHYEMDVYQSETDCETFPVLDLDDVALISRIVAEVRLFTVNKAGRRTHQGTFISGESKICGQTNPHRPTPPGIPEHFGTCCKPLHHESRVHKNWSGGSQWTATSTC